MLRWILRICVLLLALLAIAFGAFQALTLQFNPEPPEAVYPKPKDALEAQRQDVDYFAKLMALDQSYSASARSQASAGLAAIAAAPLDRGHLRVAFARIAALADNGHTSTYSKKPIRAITLPIRVSQFNDGLFVMRAQPHNADMLGARLVAIDGHPIEEVIASLGSIRGGTTPFRRVYAAFVINSSEILYGLDMAKSAERATWTVETPSGQRFERELVGAQPGFDDPLPDEWRWRSPAPIKGDPTQWVAFTPPVAPPLAFQEPDRTFRRTRLSDGCTAYIQMKSNQDENGESIQEFLQATEIDLAASKPCNIILDLRFNGGGDYTNTAAFGAHLPTFLKPGGRIYILTSPSTFSAGITTTVFVKQASSPGQVVILGEPVGDRLQFYAEGNGGCLPNAPFCFHYSTGKHDYVRPCTDWRVCFWLNWIYPARTDNLDPQETITTSYTDYLAGRDPPLDRAILLVQTARKR